LDLKTFLRPIVSFDNPLSMSCDGNKVVNVKKNKLIQ